MEAAMLTPGIYEKIVNRLVAEELKKIPPERRLTKKLDGAEASLVLAQYLAKIVEKALDRTREKTRAGTNEKERDAAKLAAQVGLVNALIALLREKTNGPDADGPDADGNADDELGALDIVNFADTEARDDADAAQLLALLEEKNPELAAKKKISEIAVRPETSLAHSSIFTRTAKGEPQLESELRREIASADEIDLLVSFIRVSGTNILLEALKKFTQRGGRLRVLTTSYTGTTEAAALDALAALPNTEIRVSYDTKRTRLHAKAYIFRRGNGFTTAYVGSSNLSRAAISDGLEWNVKLTAQDLPEAVEKIEATFESFAASKEFEKYDPQRFADALKREFRSIPTAGTSAQKIDFSSFDIRPFPYQKEILDALETARTIHRRHRNLVVAATGTGKTVISAFDYKNFCAKNPSAANRLLFLAHRKEILDQSLTTFRAVLNDENFGELFVAGERPESLEHVFASVQSVNSQELRKKLRRNFFDYVVVDEFHHAAAGTYKALLNYFCPRELVGLTATPERADGGNVIDDYFDGRIAAEIRLPDAVERGLLCPFQYFGVADTVDLREVAWTRGGYDARELSELYTGSDGEKALAAAKKRVAHVLKALEKHVADVARVKGLGFCVSIEHAKFMAENFSAAGVPAICICGNDDPETRRDARERLAAENGELRFIFTVDVYNEGVDIPAVNTILFLRPTESLTVFLQQLGRGLRLCKGKECLTVLDFIGAANRRYNFEEKLAALLARTHHSVGREISLDFPSVPRGCFISLEKKAQEAILENIRASILGARGNGGLLERIASFGNDSGKTLTLGNFTRWHRLNPRALYSRFKKSFARLCVDAGARDDFSEPAEKALGRTFAKLAAADSLEWIRFLERFLTEILPPLGAPDVPAERFAFDKILTPRERRMLQMFYVSVWDKTASARRSDGNGGNALVEDWRGNEVVENWQTLARSPILLGELRELLALREDAVNFTAQEIQLGFDCPLEVHSRYTRDQILVAMDFLAPKTIHEGVKFLREKNADLLFVTLKKSDKDYSPTTMYRDYSLSETLFHWQSQSTTPENSETGRRYIASRNGRNRILIFVREAKRDELGETELYTFLGTAKYDSHEGSRPMNVVWKLDVPIPARFLKKTNALVVA